MTIMVVYEMLRWHAPPVLILLALLVQWNTQIPHTNEPKLMFVMFLGRLKTYVFAKGNQTKSSCHRCTYMTCLIFPTHTHVKKMAESSIIAKDRDFVEVFSGQAEISKSLRKVS